MKSVRIVNKLPVFAIVVLLVIPLFLQPQLSTTFAQELPVVTKKSNLDIDTSVVIEGETFGRPGAILITPVFLGIQKNLDYEDWYRGLFYYLSSDRFNFKDIPAHYIIDKEGQIYEGISGGVEQTILVDDRANNPIVIFYLAERGDSDFSEASKKSIRSFLLSLANQNEIEANKLEVANLQLKIKRSEQIVELATDTLYGSWQLTFDNFIDYIEKNYKPTPKQYSVKLVEFKNPTAQVDPNTEVVLKIKLKNESKYSIYAGGDSELFLANPDGNNSKFFLNETWVSKSQVPLLPGGTIFKAGEERTFEFKLKAPLEFGKVSESFIVTNGLGQRFSGTRISVELNIARKNLKVLEILDTETGTLNVRNNPGSSGELIGKASPGERYIWIDQSSNWYKIKYESRTGWVYGKYVRII